MKLRAFDIPDDPTSLPEWLEEHLMGLHLQQVVAELCVLGNTPPSPGTGLTDVLGGQLLQDVLQTGLRSLSGEQLRLLIRRPQLLVELQQVVLEKGGDYWTTVPVSDEMQENTRKTWHKLKQAIAEETPKSEPARPLSSASKAWLWAGSGWLAATAAAILAIFVRSDRVRELETQLTQQTAVIDALRKEMREQRSVAVARVAPADLPETGETTVHATVDPGDLPEGDPQDLPETE